MKNKFTTVCILGLPRSGTTHLVASLQAFGNGNFTNAADGKPHEKWHQNVEEHFFDFTDSCYRYKVIKNPQVILRLDNYIQNLIKLKTLQPETLFVICVRNYNDAIYSLHSLWKDAPHKADNEYDDNYLVFLKNKSRSYKQTEKNILTCKKFLKDVVVLSHQDTILKTHPEKIMSDLNVDYHNKIGLNWEPRSIGLKNEQSSKFVDLGLEDAYINMLSNPSIRRITYQNEKVNWL